MGNSVKAERVVIYTAIFGGFDVLKQPEPQDVDCDFVCFTDMIRDQKRVGAWRIIYVPTQPDVHPRLQAKQFKLLSHTVFPEGRLHYRYSADEPKVSYRGSIWVDGSLRVRSNCFARDMLEAVNTSGWAMFAHPSRNCILDEASASLRYPKYPRIIEDQVKAYIEAGVPPKSGLYACGVIARREPLKSSLKRANEIWWRENLRWSLQDQISLPFILMKEKLSVDTIPGNLWQNSWCEWSSHKRDL